MLTSDLVRARVRGPTLRPLRPDPDDPAVAEVAEAVHDTFRRAAAERWRIGDVVAELDEALHDAPDPKLARGIARVAQDRCDTETGAIDDPGALRLELFRRAAAKGPLGLRRVPGLARTLAEDVIAEVAAEKGLEPGQIAAELYADLPSQRRVTSYRVPDPGWLVRRYDVALVQALLLSATRLRVVLESPETPRVRQLLRWVKFHQLLHAARLDGDSLELVLDGPMSLFGASTRYGLALAAFFPALLLQDGPWTLEATVLWTKARHSKVLTLGRADGYVSHYADTGAWETRTQQHFVARFAEVERPWTLTDNVLPVALSHADLVLPDYVLTRGDRVVHLEIAGYWRPDTLARRIEALDARPDVALLVAVSKKLAGAKGAAPPAHPRLVPYTDVLSVDKVLAAAEALLAAQDAAPAPARPRRKRA